MDVTALVSPHCLVYGSLLIWIDVAAEVSCDPRVIGTNIHEKIPVGTRSATRRWERRRGSDNTILRHN